MMREEVMSRSKERSEATKNEGLPSDDVAGGELKTPRPRGQERAKLIEAAKTPAQKAFEGTKKI